MFVQGQLLQQLSKDGDVILSLSHMCLQSRLFPAHGSRLLDRFRVLCVQVAQPLSLRMNLSGCLSQSSAGF